VVEASATILETVILEETAQSLQERVTMTIHLDVDGVSANFNAGMLEIHGLPEDFPITSWEYYKDAGMTTKEFWRPAKRLGRGFYVPCVPKYPWFKELFDAVYAADDDIVLVTSNPWDAGLYASKLDWIDHYIGKRPTIFCDEKWRLAKPGCLLIDDNDDNVLDYREAGGAAILFPQPWNENRGLCDQRMDFLRRNLNSWKVLQEARKEQSCV
jgi:hypothetical protein